MTPPPAEDATPRPGEPAETPAAHSDLPDRFLLRFASRLVEWARRQRGRRSPRTERVLLVAAVALFVGVTWFAFRNLPEIDRPLRWDLLIAAGILAVPAIAVLNALEYRVSGKILGHRIRFIESLRVSVLASAANRLPIPGAVLVRVGALRRLGSGFGKATTSTAAVGLAWMGTSFTFAGALQLPPGRWAIGAALLGGGVAVLTLAYALMRWQAARGSAPRLMGELLLIELGAVVLPTIKTYIVLHAIGFPVSIAQAAALTVPTVVAAATGFFPGGLGLREVIAGALSPLVGLPAAIGPMATAINRLVGLVPFVLMASGFLLWSWRDRGRARETEEEIKAESAVGPPVPHDD